MKLNNVITIDGPSGVGKGTVCLLIARKYHYDYLDSGALYRLAALEVQRQSLADADIHAQASAIAQMQVSFSITESGVDVLLNNHLVGDELRLETTGNIASKLAALSEVRDSLLQFQRKFLKKNILVADGRDMGTVVFPEALLKIFLDASVEIRAERRYKQLKLQGENVNLADLRTSIAERDFRDRNRSISPLKPASDAVVIDTSQLTVNQVFEQIDDLIQSRFF